ncbi:MAG: ABC transporter permease subunit, partial [Anaerolineales bacterium]
MSKPSTPPEKSHKSILKTGVNWSLITGCVLVIIIIILAIYGPSIAPNDPREHKLIIQIDGKWLTPPYPAFTPGYPLGSDNLGRDLYSWLLWSIRPTMILVIIVAGTRMLLGILIGVIAGWSDRTVGRIFDWLIAGALAVPTLIAALIIITAVGFKLGVWAFVVGMSFTGWAETAQLVRERTRTIKGQESIEAAIALGASNSQTFFLHILPQVMPMIWMLLAFEVANSLVTSAGLGFLGYYLGGAVFTEVDDFVYQRISEMPELGQMLATAWMVLDEPWAMVAAGSVVFAVVLAFNLLGDGLQARLTRKLGGMRNLYSFIAGEVIPWLNRYISEPVQNIIHRRAFRYAAGAFLVAFAGLSILWMHNLWTERQESATKPVVTVGHYVTATRVTVTAANDDPEATPTGDSSGSENGQVVHSSPLQVPGGHIWASEGHDPWRARWVDYSGPLTTTIQWTLEREGGFVGGPAIDAEGILYIAAREVTDNGVESGNLIALDGEGTVIWETTLDRKPVGSPALAADGTIYVADKLGLNAFSPAGALLWHYTSPEGDPTADGPIIDADGNLYFKSYAAMNALAPDGTLRWRTAITENAASLPPHLSVDEQAVFWRNLGYNAKDGSPYD